MTISPSIDYAVGPLPSATVTLVEDTVPQVTIAALDDQPNGAERRVIGILKVGACNRDGRSVDCAAEDGRSAFRDGRFLPDLPFSSATDSRGGAV
ncbi:MAG TPA: hypothetical protein VNH11_05500 [Pirellulales bacterium]|nr:hypothetical protein [Pirellulales bacterium]